MLSVIMIVKNEEERLRRCLQCVSWADEIIVFDSGSTDNTVAIAKEFTDKVYSAPWAGYGIQKQRALEQATGTWVLNLDADEFVNEALRQEIGKAIEQDQYDAYRVSILMNFYGRQLYHSWSAKQHIRLFKRAGAHYNDNIVHEAIVLPKSFRIGQLHAGIEHHSLRDITHAIQKLNAYSSFSANSKAKAHSKPSFIKTILGACWMFFRCYIIQGGILEGKDGFLLAVLSAEHSFYRGIKMIYPDR